MQAYQGIKEGGAGDVTGQGIGEAWRLIIRTLDFPPREMGATAGFRAEKHHLN